MAGMGSRTDTNPMMAVSDHPGMIMISAPLNGNNWLSCSRSVRIAMEGCVRLGFIDGTCGKPVDGSADLKQWKITDSMVTWILNSISKYIVNAYLYSPFARALWLELEMRESQTTSDVYLWFTCGSNQAKMEEMEASHLIQFLTGRTYEYRGGSRPKNNMRRKGPIDKRNIICEHCNRPGHGKDTCFKLHGVSDWYKELTDQKRRNGNGGRGYVVTEDLSGNSENSIVPGGSVDVTAKTGGNLVTELMEALKLIQAKTPQDPVHVHFAQGDEMAGIIVDTKPGTLNFGTWIVDTGATNPMCGDASIFHSLHTLSTPTTITLRDNSVTQATQSGTIKLSTTLSLKNVLLVPSFKYNLLSVSQLCKFNSICFIFLTSTCMLQDLKTKNVLAIGRQIGRLYYLDRNSFISVPVSHSKQSREPFPVSESHTLVDDYERSSMDRPGK
ncbi:UNVERIFIED_CONTAM: hypothetical protein Slati_4208100 [Sesamum latifolium]|uniref:Uncharacterized protein n=1 Tax=Sesamum latifolium TaxID=2727402 RepID=A0AAW2TBX2_9LAMI